MPFTFHDDMAECRQHGVFKCVESKASGHCLTVRYFCKTCGREWVEVYVHTNVVFSISEGKFLELLDLDKVKTDLYYTMEGLQTETDWTPTKVEDTING